jgi:cobalt-zinc-cadmium efflux system protein
MTGTHHSHHDHHPAPGQAQRDFGRAFAVGILLNLGFVAIEAIYGFVGNSVALLADAGHNLGDVLGLVVAWIASILSRRPPTTRYTYGLGGSSILAALFNAVFLLVAVGAIAWEAIGRLTAPQPVAGATVIVVAAIGIVVNGITAWLFAAGRAGDINVRGAFLHMAPTPRCRRASWSPGSSSSARVGYGWIRWSVSSWWPSSCGAPGISCANP